MENLLFKRSKNLTAIISGALILLAAVLYLFIFREPALDQHAVRALVTEDQRAVENALEKRVTAFKERAALIFVKYRDGALEHADPDTGEALIITRGGAIEKYYGEIYYFKPGAVDVGGWLFLEKKKNLFFMQRMAANVFYVRRFCRLDHNFMLDRLTRDAAVKELRFHKSPGGDFKDTFHFDETREQFSSTHRLKQSGNHLTLYLRFSQKDMSNHYKKREERFLFAFLFGICLMGSGYFYTRRKLLSRLLWFGMLVLLLVFTSRWGAANLYLAVGGIFVLRSLYEILILLLILVSLLYWFREKIKLNGLSFVLFNLSLAGTIYVGDAVIRSVNFNYTGISFDYFILVMTLFLLHLLPLFFVRNIALEKDLRSVGGVLILQAAVLAAGYFFFHLPPVNALMLSAAAAVFLFLKRTFFINVLVIFLLSISIFFQVEEHVEHEKKAFVADNLKNIFLNQTNYAKFIAREIVHQLNHESAPFHELFEENASQRLKTLWQHTLAYRENIASGIFVVAPDGEVINHHSYLIPFLEVKTRNVFPFWAIEDASVMFYGRPVTLAVATLSVSQKGREMGRIVVQVLNSPELILRHRDEVNIFNLDNKIRGTELSYIKLNEQNRIVENPSNINLQNVAGLLASNEQWISFRFIDRTFKGYIFKHDRDTIIIFFPSGSLFKQLSEIVIIFLFLLLLFFLFYFKYMGSLDWRSVYYSFSLRVFLILIVISLVTAVIFSLFSLDFYSDASLLQTRQMIYERGRTAQNIGLNQLEAGDAFTLDHLLLLSKILDTDVTVYENGVLTDTSNYRKIIDNRVPDHLHSNILELLDRKNQKFVLLDTDGGFHLYFKIYDYILDVEFPYTWRKILAGESYYTDFIITLFFILTVIGISTAFFFKNKITAPIDGLNKGMADVKKGFLHRLKKIPSEIELKNLYMGFNEMIAGIREQKKSISEISRMKTVIKLGRRVAHEVKNPLTPIKLSAEQILMALDDKNPNYEAIIRQSVNYIIDETNHLKKVSYGFLDLSKLDELKPETFDLAAVTRDEVFKYSQVYSHVAFRLAEGSEKGPLTVTLDKFKLKQVFKNLISNAVEAIGEKEGEVKILLKRRGDRVRLEISDSGAGMDEDGLELIYNVDYSTKKMGTGLGLFIVKRIIELHKGRIDVESEKGKGTRFMLDLPMTVE